jgi:hypothetical protein
MMVSFVYILFFIGNEAIISLFIAIYKLQAHDGFIRLYIVFYR